MWLTLGQQIFPSLPIAICLSFFFLQFPLTVSNICCHLCAKKGISELPPSCMMKWQTEWSQREHHQQLFTLLFSLNFLFSKVYSSYARGCVTIKPSMTHATKYIAVAMHWRSNFLFFLKATLNKLFLLSVSRWRILL